MIFRKKLAALLLPFLLAGCSDNAGRLAVPSETTNGIEIAVAGLQLSVNSPSFKTLYIYDVDYHPIYGTGFTDSLQVEASAELQYSLADSGTYNIFVYNASLDSGFFIPALAVHPDSSYQISADLSGVGLLNGRTQTPVFGVAVYIPGSSMGSWLGSQGEFEISSVPPGSYTLIGEQILHAPEGPGLSIKHQTVTLSESDTLNINLN